MKRYISFVLATALLLSLFTACGSSSQSADDSTAETTQAETVEAEDAVLEQSESSTVVEEQSSNIPEDAYTLPLEETKTLVLWHEAATDVLNVLAEADYENHPGMIYGESVTGVHIAHRTTTADTAVTDLALMVTSGDMPDLLYNAASYYTGGGAAAVEDEVLLDLAPYVEAGYTPNYEAAFSISEQQYYDVRTDDGYITTFLSIYENGPDAAGGMWIRKDWLDELGLDVPETYDELHEVLTLFQSEFGATEAYYTYIEGDSHFTMGYGVASELQTTESYNSANFFQIDGVVHFSALEDEWLEAITTMRQWYAEGLFGTDLANHTFNVSDSGFIKSVCTGATGVFRCGTRMISMVTENGTDYDPDFEVVAMPDPVVNEGDPMHYNWPTKGYAFSGLSVSASCEDIPLALAWCDYWYSEEGSRIAEYGEEGVSYTMVDGKPEWTELVTDNSDGITMMTAMALYQLPVGWYHEVTTDTTGWTDAAIDALDIWSRNWDNAYMLPATLTLSGEEATEFSGYFGEIATYYTEMLARFVAGEESLENYENFRQNLIDMGIEECIVIIQDALDRYYSRGE